MTDGLTLEGAIPPESVAVLVYATFPNAKAAVETGRVLVEKRLAGCVNVLPAMTSVYVWHGQTEIAEEAVLIAKTMSGSAEAAAVAIRAHHSYETPAILVLPVYAASAPYLDWLRGGMGN